MLKALIFSHFILMTKAKSKTIKMQRKKKQYPKILTEQAW